MHVRRDIWSLESVDVWEPVTLAYARAVATMRARDPEDPTSWRYQAAIHGSREPPREGWNQCQHRSWWFLPWHRMYIYRFEEIVRSIVLADGGPDDWGLPYWNYSKGFPSNTLPPAFREPRMPDGSENPLFVAEPGRNPAGINRGAAMPESALAEEPALSEEQFTPPPPPGFGGTAVPQPEHFADRAFAGAVENAPHNVVHGLVGGPFQTGWMSDPDSAAQDPIFWLHHSNVDRLWARWRRGGGADPTDPAFLAQEYPLFDRDGRPVTMRVGDVIDPAREVNLDYRYDDELAGRAPRARARAAAVTAAAGAPGQTRTLAATGDVVLAGQTSVALPMPGPTRAMAAAALAPGGRLLLTVEDVDVIEDTGTVYAVYLGEPDDLDERRLAGHITFFGAGHVHHAGHGGGISTAYDVTAIAQRLQREGRWPAAEQRVTFVPVGLDPPPGEEPAGPAQPPTRARVGRVTLAGAGADLGAAIEGTVPGGGPQPGPGEVLAWEDDPGQPPSPLLPVVRPTPRLEAGRLAIAIADPRPPDGPPADHAAFLWWVAAEALERGRDLWARLLPDLGGWQAQAGTALRVQVDADPPQFNAYYDRHGLAFFHDTIAGVTCWSGESPDIVCHELGHAVLDAVRPQLWDAAGTEPAAFHESFGDISALLCALELGDLRELVLQETAGKPWRSSRVSRVAEQLGWAIRTVSPDRAEAGCLRDASNSWFYRDPATLPPDAPATQLSTEPHFFARIFTGAALKAIAAMFDMQPGRDEAALHQAGLDFAAVLVDAIRRAPVVPGYFSQLAAHMLEADEQRFAGRHRDALRFAFVRHGVLALSSANAVARGVAAVRGITGPPPAASGDLPETAVDGAAYGLPRALIVRACGHPKRFGVAGAAPDTGAVATAGSDRTAELFVEDLFRQGRVDAGGAAGTDVLVAPVAYKTHTLDDTDAGFVLRRRVFDCGLHPPGMG
ncbi:MAG TPA: tyrosinase family protein [Solirubrobacteraceae bacterium]|nr:tyrosinase family protein [Solirubrobacteraceae bacterium]